MGKLTLTKFSHDSSHSHLNQTVPAFLILTSEKIRYMTQLFTVTLTVAAGNKWEILTNCSSAQNSRRLKDNSVIASKYFAHSHVSGTVQNSSHA